MDVHDHCYFSIALNTNERFVGLRLLTTLEWCFKRWLCLRSDPRQMAPLPIFPVEES